MSEVHRVSPEEAQRLLTEEGYAYVDVRTEAEFAAGHPTGAFNVPFLLADARGMTPNPDFIDVFSKAFPKDRRIVVGCKSGGRSLKAAAALMERGYAAVVDQRAGFDGARNAFGQVVEPGWRDKGLPSETITAGGSYAELMARTE